MLRVLISLAYKRPRLLWGRGCFSARNGAVRSCQTLRAKVSAALLMITLTASAQDLAWRCADISFQDELDAGGAVYTDGGMPGDAVEILKRKGLNSARLRLFHTPMALRDALPDVLHLAARLDSLALPWILDFHYSDTWADPGRQHKPAAWLPLDFSALQDSVFAYTTQVLNALLGSGLQPAMVQIGNEITAGILWDDGRVGGPFDTPVQWDQLAALLTRAAQAVRSAAGDSMQIMVHLDRGGDLGGARWFFDNLQPYQVDFDVIGLSYYPWWHGSLSDLEATLDTVAAAYGKPIILAEFAYPWTLQWFDDVHNIVGLPAHVLPGYPATPEGQRDFIRDVMQLVHDTPGGLGACYWEPTYVSTAGLGSPWENVTLFDDSGAVLPGAAALGGTLNTHTVSEHPPDAALHVYPNPADDWIRVAYDDPMGDCAHIDVIDVLGRVVLAGPPRCSTGSMLLHVDGLAPGLYMVALQSRARRHSAPLVIAPR